MSQVREYAYFTSPKEISIDGDEQKIAHLHGLLQGSVISSVIFRDPGAIDIQGSDADKKLLWQLTIEGSVRFTFTNPANPAAWLVEVNFDHGGMIRRSEKAMMLAMCGAMVDRVTFDEALILSAEDGRTIEMPYVLNPDSLTMRIMPDIDGRV